MADSTSTPARRFFVSYAHEDRAWAEWIAWQLEEEGHHVLIQAWDFVAGDGWIRRMAEGIEHTDHTIAVLSPAYLVSRFCIEEWDAAWHRRARGDRGFLVPLRVVPFEMPAFFATVVFADLFDIPEGAARRRLLSTVTAVLDGRHKPAGAVAFPAPGRTAWSEPEFPGSATETWSTTAVVSDPPPDNTSFTGRVEEIERVVATVQPGPEGVGVNIFAFDGMPGVGKSTLAVHLFHLLAGRFTGRRVYVDLRANTAGLDPAAPVAVLYELLRDSGVDVTGLPADAAVLGRVWRDQLASAPAILLLDDAAGSEQVRPLLPGRGDCLVLITSRKRLATLGRDPGANLRSLRPLNDRDALALLERVANRTLTDDERIAATALVRLHGNLPLAVAISGVALQDATRETVHDLIADVQEARRSREDAAYPRDNEQQIFPQFDVSYRRLAEDKQVTLRRLALVPGKRVDEYATAAVTGLPRAAAASHLRELADDSLLDKTRQYYRMHDLLRDYSRALASADAVDTRNGALSRLMGYYEYTACLADGYLARHRRPVATHLESPRDVPAFGSRDEALAWARAERENIEACIEYAAAHGEDRWFVGLTASISAFMRNDGPWHKAESLHLAAVDAAHRLGDELAEANALSELAFVRRLTGNFPGATEAVEAALRGYRRNESDLGIANALADLGILRDIAGDRQASIETLRQALSWYRRIGEQLGEANVLNDLGYTLRGGGSAGDLDAAIESFAGARDLYERCGNELGKAHALNQLGVALRMDERYPEAVQALTDALGSYSALRNRLGEANALTNIATVQAVTGTSAEAARTLDKALDIHERLGNRRGEANTLEQLGRVHHGLGNIPTAISAFEQSLTRYRALNLAADASRIEAELEQLREAD